MLECKFFVHMYMTYLALEYSLIEWVNLYCNKTCRLFGYITMLIRLQICGVIFNRCYHLKALDLLNKVVTNTNKIQVVIHKASIINFEKIKIITENEHCGNCRGEQRDQKRWPPSIRLLEILSINFLGGLLYVLCFNKGCMYSFQHFPELQYLDCTRTWADND